VHARLRAASRAGAPEVVAAVPAELLEPGRYELTLTPAEGTGGASIAFTFEIVR
jgi:hypothetical protein